MNDMQTLVDIAGMTAELIESGELVRVVRCKDCKCRFNGCCYNRKSDRINFGVYVADDWFCADGERNQS